MTHCHNDYHRPSINSSCSTARSDCITVTAVVARRRLNAINPTKTISLSATGLPTTERPITPTVRPQPDYPFCEALSGPFSMIPGHPMREYLRRLDNAHRRSLVRRIVFTQAPSLVRFFAPLVERQAVTTVRCHPVWRCVNSVAVDSRQAFDIVRTTQQRLLVLVCPVS